MEVCDQLDNRCSSGKKTSWIKGHEAFGNIRILTCNYFDGNANNFKFREGGGRIKYFHKEGTAADPLGTVQICIFSTFFGSNWDQHVQYTTLGGPQNPRPL